MHEEMHKFKWVSVKCVVGVGVCLFFVKECCFRVRVCDKKLSITAARHLHGGGGGVIIMRPFL